MALEGKYDTMLLLLDEVLSRGFNALHFIGGLASHFRDLLVCSRPGSLPLLEYGPETAQKYTRQAQACTQAFLFHALHIATQAEAAYKESNFPRLHLEMALVRMSRLTESQAPVAKSVAPATTTPSAPAVVQQPLRHHHPMLRLRRQHRKSLPRTTGCGTRCHFHQRTDAAKSNSQKSKPAEEVQDTEEEMEITQERLNDVLPGLFQLFEKQPHLANTLSRCKPEVIEETKIRFVVINTLQKEWIEEHQGRLIDTYLRKALKNKKAQMIIDVEESQTLPKETIATCRKTRSSFWQKSIHR